MAEDGSLLPVRETILVFLRTVYDPCFKDRKQDRCKIQEGIGL